MKNENEKQSCGRVFLEINEKHIHVECSHIIEGKNNWLRISIFYNQAKMMEQDIFVGFSKRNEEKNLQEEVKKLSDKISAMYVDVNQIVLKVRKL